MKNKTTFFLLCLINSFVLAQTNTPIAINDMVIKEPYLYAIEKEGKLRVWQIATQQGIYKTSLPESGCITTMELLCHPELYWEREPLAIGAKMAIKKLWLTKDKLFFLTTQNGIGVYQLTNRQIDKIIFAN